MATILTPFVQWCYHAMNFHKEVVNNPRNEALFPGYFSPIVFHSVVLCSIIHKKKRWKLHSYRVWFKKFFHNLGPKYDSTMTNLFYETLQKKDSQHCMFISGFTKFGIKVAWRLQFFGYLRTLNLEFQKAASKIGDFLALQS